MSSHCEILLFGDLTCDFDAGLQVLVGYKDNNLLTTFFERVAFALRVEIGALSFREREREGSVKFTTLVELLARLRGAPQHLALRKALICVHQFACFIHHYSGIGRSYPAPSQTHIIGLCTGLLTGVAVSCCESLSELMIFAVQTVVVAFRTGVCVSEVGDRIEPSNGSLAPWSALIPGLTGVVAEKILNTFCVDKGLPVASRPYISAYANTGVTLSGPPSILEDLLRSKRLPKSSSIKIAIHAPYHAAHLFNSSDLDNILQRTLNTEFATRENRITIVSSLSGNDLSGATFSSLLRSALVEILLEPLRIDKMSDEIANDLKSSAVGHCIVKPIASLASQAFVTALRKIGRKFVTVDNSMNEASDSNTQYTSDSGHLGHSKLAIVGYSGRFPDANSNEAFWDLLHEGRDVASETPKERWDVKTHVDPTLKKKNTSGTPYGCWLKEPGNFDAKFFSMSPREAPQIDPAQRLALMTAYEAMENAGMVPDATPSTQRDRVGVFYGTTSNDWGETNSSQDVDTYYIPGSCRAFIPGRQNYFFKFSGPSFSVDTACSSSLAAMHMACNALWRGDIDTAVCGGTNVMTNPDITAGLDRGHFLSRTGNCKTFDDGADGYCRGEGVVTIIVKRLEDAIADNDPILGIILGAYTNHSAEAESITRPHVGAQKAIFEKVLASSSVDPSSVGYVEMHGTGTQAGDAREMESVLSTFATSSAPKVRRSRAQPLYLGSAKANVGHGESVSGVIALTKVLMMLEKNEIPPHCGIKTKINSKFPMDLKERNVHIALKPTPWLREEGKTRRAFINNFSAAGGNSSVLVEDPPEFHKTQQQDVRSTHMVAVSAKSSTALSANIRAITSFVQNTAPSLPSLSYTTTARRTHHSHRIMVSGSTLSEISTKLNKALLSSSEQHTRPKSKLSVAFAFTGQGSQYPGMAFELLQFSSFRKDLERFDSIVQKQTFPPIMPLVMQLGGDIADFEPLVVQLATTCIQMAMARLWQSWGIEPYAVVGHSLGEYAALNVAGVLSDADTIYLTGKRAQLLQEYCTRDTHSMLAVNTSVDEIRSILDGLDVEIACRNAPKETVLSGTNAAIDLAVAALAPGGFKKTRLRVPFAFHSSQVDVILKDFADAARGVTFSAPKIPVLSPLLGEVITSSGIFGPTYLSRHCREAVNFSRVLKVATSNLLNESTVWIEIGPHPVVVGLLKSNLGPVTILPTLQRKKDTWTVLAGSLSTLYEAGAEIRWDEYQRDFKSSLDVLRLPSYSWDLKYYWMQYVNDWSLYKGDAAFLSGLPTPKLSTTCVQKLVQENTEGTKITVIGESDLLREDLDPFVRGHRVNGVALCTPSVYAEQALVLGDYLRKQKAEWESCLVDVQHMDVQKPLAVKSKGKGPQLLRCRAILDTTTGRTDVEFYSVTAEGKKLVKHAECYITFPQITSAAAESQKAAAGILSRMVQLRKSVEDDDRVQKLKGSSGYKLVSSLASYDDEYRGVAEVTLDSGNLEAVAKVKFDKTATKGSFNVNPYIIDNFGQPALFVMNANDKADLDKEVFVNHGWKSLQFYKEVSIKKTYHSYVKMDGPKEDGMYSGDMTVFEGEEVVACFRGVKAQGVPRRLMDYIVHMRDDTKTGPPRATNMLAAEQISAPTVTVQVGTAAPTTVVVEQPSNSWAEALAIISEESCIPVADLTGDRAFSDLGVDSLLSLLCASRFREELGFVYESSIFEEYPTVKELHTFWDKGAAAAGTSGVSGNDAILNSMFHDEEDASSDSGSKSRGESSDGNSSQTDESASSLDLKSQDIKHKATSLLLQGNPVSTTTTKTLFLLPDGSGSASSYASLPFVDVSLAIVALNCPYMKNPSQYPHGIASVSTLYVAEIQRRQPHGPYALGGWSVGGIFAYHCAKLLLSQGETVSDLVLIDCPVPAGLDRLPKRYFEYCENIGLLGDTNATTGARKAPPPWLIPHFEACVDSLHDYYAVPLTPAQSAPNTLVIWAGDAIDAHVANKFERRAEDPEGLRFLTEERVDFGPCGWETLLPQEKMRFEHVRGANHFGMMKGEHAHRLSKIIGQGLVAE